MSIQFSGLGSGLPVQEWVSAMIQAESTRLTRYEEEKTSTQNSRTALNSVEAKFSSLRSALEKITDANLASTLDLFERKTAASSDETIATATASNKSAVQKIDLEVKSLATSTTAQSISEIGQTIDGSETFTDLSNGDAESGTFSLYTDGVKHEITIEDTDTVNDIIADINTISGLEASVDSGKFVIKTDDAEITELKLGSNADTSNFLNVMHLSTADAEAIIDPTYEKSYSSTYSVSKVDTDATIVDGSANLNGTFSGTYTFKIGGSEFTVDSNTTIQDLISKINNDDDAGVVASFDYNENKFKLTATEAGETAINLEDTSGDFLEQVGLITAGGDSLSSQTLGSNAEVYLNGSTEVLEVNSNTITSDISGITGLTINLKDVTETGETISINVEQDTGALTSAVEDFVGKFNKMVNEIDKETKRSEDLAGEYSLTSLRNSLRTNATDMVSGLSEYNSFGMIGISTGDVGTSVDEETSTLEFDKDAFLKALQDNPSEVKALLVGDKEQGITGVLQQLESKVENAIDSTNGYFAAREDSMDATISSLDDAILREEERLENRREFLQNKFNQMDQYISQMQQQQSALAML